MKQSNLFTNTIVLFSLLFFLNCSSNTTSTPNTESENEVVFVALKATEDMMFTNGLEATVNGKKYDIIETKEEYDGCMTIVDERDFDNDGYKDILIQRVLACGGNGVPLNPFFFCSYHLKEDKFIISKDMGESAFEPEIEKHGDVWSVEITSTGIRDLFEIKEKYILENGNAKLISALETEPLPTISEMKSEDFTEDEKENGKVLKIDLDGDGKEDEITGKYWERWGSMMWEVNLSSGASFSSSNGYLRIGVLSTKTNGVHDLVGGLNDKWIWNGNAYELNE